MPTTKFVEASVEEPRPGVMGGSSEVEDIEKELP
jgi:hypothetical protein